MALFSRRSKNQPASDSAPTAETEAAADRPEAADASLAAPGGAPTATSPTADTAAEASPAAEPVPHVGISISTYGAPERAAQPATPPATAPAPRQTVPGLPDNATLQAALAALPEKPGSRDIMNVMRQTLQGTLYVRVRGDAKALLAEGRELTLAVSEIDGKRFLLAFTGGAALQASIRADGDAQTSALGQPVTNVLRNVTSGPYAGMILDPASPGARLVLPTQLIAKALDEGDPDLTLKNLLTAPREAATAARVVAALPTAKLWVAAGKAPGGERIGLAELRGEGAERVLQVFSHPLEVLTAPGLSAAAGAEPPRPVPFTAEQLATTLRSDAGITGILIDPAGPWLQLSRADLAPILALAPDPAA